MKNMLVTEEQAIEKAQFDLVKGDFSPEDALEINNHLILKKINFHEVRSFSHLMKFGLADESSLKRIKELKQDKEAIQNLVLQAREQGKTLRIKATISIELI